MKEGNERKINKFPPIILVNCTRGFHISQSAAVGTFRSCDVNCASNPGRHSLPCIRYNSIASSLKDFPADNEYNRRTMWFTELLSVVQITVPLYNRLRDLCTVSKTSKHRCCQRAKTECMFSMWIDCYHNWKSHVVKFLITVIFCWNGIVINGNWSLVYSWLC